MSTIIMPVIVTTPSAPAPIVHRFVFTTRDGRTAHVSVTSPSGTEAEVVRRDLQATGLEDVEIAPQGDSDSVEMAPALCLAFFGWIGLFMAGFFLRALLDAASLVDFWHGQAFWTTLIRIWLFSLVPILIGTWLAVRSRGKRAA